MVHDEFKLAFRAVEAFSDHLQRQTPPPRDSWRKRRVEPDMSLSRVLWQFKHWRGPTPGPTEMLETFALERWLKQFKPEAAAPKGAVLEAFHSLNRDLHWENLRSLVANAADAMPASPIQSAVEHALEVPDSASEDPAAGFDSFAAKLFQTLDPWVAFQILLAILFFIATPYWDVQVKDALTKASAAEDRRELAREIAKEIGQLNLPPAYMATRRYASQVLSVRMNPKANSPVVGKLKMGEVVEVIEGCQKDWTRVTFQDGQGTVITGWAYTRYLKQLEVGR